MYAHAVDQAGEQLRELRLTEWEDLGLGGLALALALVATQVWPEFALPLFLGGIAVWTLGMRAMWRRWDLVDRLAGEPDAYVIPEVYAHAAREASMGRRRSYAAYLRVDARDYERENPGLHEELQALASELEDETLELEPACAVACARLLSDPASALLDPGSPDELRSQVRRIRSGFDVDGREPSR